MLVAEKRNTFAMSPQCTTPFPQADQLARIKREEQEMLETQSIPLRNYLMKHVMPTLTQGLIEVCKVKPDDPVDYLVSILALLICCSNKFLPLL